MSSISLEKESSLPWGEKLSVWAEYESEESSSPKSGKEASFILPAQLRLSVCLCVRLHVHSV